MRSAAAHQARGRSRKRSLVKATLAAKLKNAGSAVVQHEDSVRRVVQCRCGASQRFRGEERLWADGWGSRWEDGKRVWECASCWSPPKAPAEPPSYRVDPVMLEVAERGAGDTGRRRLEGQMVRLLDVDPKRGEAFLKAIVAHLDGKSGTGAARWRAMLEMMPLIPAEGRRRPRRRPAERAIPKLRRVPTELGKVFGVRLVTAELEGLKRAAAALGVEPRDLVRSWCVAAGVLVPVAATPAPRGAPDGPPPTPASRVGLSADATLAGAARWLVEHATAATPTPPAARAAKKKAKPAEPAKIGADLLDPEERDEIAERLLGYLEGGPEDEDAILDHVAGKSDEEERARHNLVLEWLACPGMGRGVVRRQQRGSGFTLRWRYELAAEPPSDLLTLLAGAGRPPKQSTWTAERVRQLSPAQTSALIWLGQLPADRYRDRPTKTTLCVLFDLELIDRTISGKSGAVPQLTEAGAHVLELLGHHGLAYCARAAAAGTPFAPPRQIPVNAPGEAMSRLPSARQRAVHGRTRAPDEQGARGASDR